MTYPPSPSPTDPPLPPPVDPFHPPLHDPTDPFAVDPPGAPPPLPTGSSAFPSGPVTPGSAGRLSPWARPVLDKPDVGDAEPVTAIPASPAPEYRPGVVAAPQPRTDPVNDGYYDPPTTEWPDYPAPGPRRHGPLIAVAVVVVLAMLLCGGGLLSALTLRDRTGTPQAGPTAPRPAPTTNPPTPTARTVTVVYEVTGDGPATITYLKDVATVINDPKDAGDVVHDAKLPWRITLSARKPALMLSVFATRASLNDGTLTCRILINGKEVERRTVSGPVIATACVKLL